MYIYWDSRTNPTAFDDFVNSISYSVQCTLFYATILCAILSCYCFSYYYCSRNYCYLWLQLMVVLLLVECMALLKPCTEFSTSYILYTILSYTIILLYTIISYTTLYSWLMIFAAIHLVYKLLRMLLMAWRWRNCRCCNVIYLNFFSLVCFVN